MKLTLALLKFCPRLRDFSLVLKNYQPVQAEMIFFSSSKSWIY